MKVLLNSDCKWSDTVVICACGCQWLQVSGFQPCSFLCSLDFEIMCFGWYCYINDRHKSFRKVAVAVCTYIYRLTNFIYIYCVCVCVLCLNTHNLLQQNFIGQGTACFNWKKKFFWSTWVRLQKTCSHNKNQHWLTGVHYEQLSDEQVFTMNSHLFYVHSWLLSHQ